MRFVAAARARFRGGLDGLLQPQGLLQERQGVVDLVVGGHQRADPRPQAKEDEQQHDEQQGAISTQIRVRDSEWFRTARLMELCRAGFHKNVL